jgi:L-iditol 2-dehydrogenase
MLIGMGTPIQTLPISDAALREVDLVGVFRYAGEYPQAISLLSCKDDKWPDFSEVITHRFEGFESIDDAFRTASLPDNQADGTLLKVVIDFSS